MKKMIAVILVIVLSLLFTGCGNTSTSSLCGENATTALALASACKNPPYLLCQNLGGVSQSLKYVYSNHDDPKHVPPEPHGKPFPDNPKGDCFDYAPYDFGCYSQPSQPRCNSAYPQYTISTDISRNNRDWNHYFKGTLLNYNVFTTGEVRNCYAFHMNYSCTIRDVKCGKDVTGTRIVYARDYSNEVINNDNAWIEVGRFYYNSTKGESISVDINWDCTLGPINVYSMVVVMDKDMSGASYSASWGDVVTLYSYI